MGLSESGNVADTIDSDYVSAVVSVGTSQVLAKAGAANLIGRQEILIFNDSLSTIYFGPSGVTTSGSTKGIPISPQETVNLPFGEGINIYLIAGSASNNVIIQELS